MEADDDDLDNKSIDSDDSDDNEMFINGVEAVHNELIHAGNMEAEFYKGNV